MSAPLADTVVAILNWNGLNHLKTFFPSVAQNAAPYRVCVIDNGSTDRSVEWLRQNYPQTEIVALEKNYGFAGGYNQGLKAIEAEYVILLNSDVETPAGWLEPLVKAMVEAPDLGAAQPKLLAYRQKDEFEYAGGAGGYIDRLGYPFVRGRIFDANEKDKGQYDAPPDQPLFWTTGAAMIVKKQTFEALGGLDADFFAHMEEIDFCWRLQNAGYRLRCVPESKVYHLGGGTLDKSNPRKTFLNFRNNLFLLFKNLPFFTALVVKNPRLWLDGLAALKFLSEAKVGDFWAVARAHLAFYLAVPGLLKKRKFNKTIRTTYNADAIYPGLIIWRHYGQKINRFSDLHWKPKKN